MAERSRILRVTFRNDRRKSVRLLLRKVDEDVYETDGDVEVSFGRGRSIKVYAMYSDAEGGIEFVLTVEEAELQTLAIRCFSAAVVSYVKGLLKLDANDAEARLAYCFRHLASGDPVVAADAFVDPED